MPIFVYWHIWLFFLEEVVNVKHIETDKNVKFLIKDIC